MNQSLFGIIFAISVTGMFVLDLSVHRKSQFVSLREALAWTGAWIALAGAFAAALYVWQGHVALLEFTTAYFIELSLSVDNLFVFLLIFRHFQVPANDQHKVLFWGIVGAVVMRAIFVFAGVGLFRRFAWLIYFFGAFLIYSGIRLMTNPSSRSHPERSWIVLYFRRLVPVTEGFEGNKFLVRRDRIYATPLLVVLLLIEATDLLFATDSIPAVLAITLNFVIVFTSNILAILGLRSMYFAVAGMMQKFQYLHYGLSAILIFTGIKMMISQFYEIPNEIALAAVAGILFIAVVASMTIQSQSSSD